MDQKNVTTIHLLGFPGLHGVKPLLFLLFLITYFGTISGNMLVITLVSYSKNLHCPMYFFLTQLTMSDIIVTSDIVPTMLYIILKDGITMSLSQCIIQLYFFGSCEGFECLLLTVMSYDRYLAICNPLHYGSIMNPRLCRKSIVICWLSSFLVTLIQALNISQLPFLESNVIDHFFCDLDPILQLSTSDILVIETLEMYLCIPVVLIPFLIIIISYVYIVRTILNIRSITGRQKAFTTCTSHLIVVSIFFGTLSCMYFIPIKKKSVVESKTISLFYTVVTPLLNPTIYCLRNNDIREALRKKTFLLNWLCF
ncbi:olfactory receptor 11L1-like [Bufo bufo]|uniref:olfactory receptor 11L1-like n=1 Tax=Bufo bufo TaxID=8384 RepID=UPI001ABDA5D9|nr:olfactory receptor 11L1-like [Bufo bufo]